MWERNQLRTAATTAHIELLGRYLVLDVDAVVWHEVHRQRRLVGLQLVHEEEAKILLVQAIVLGVVAEEAAEELLFLHLVEVSIGVSQGC